MIAMCPNTLIDHRINAENPNPQLYLNNAVAEDNPLHLAIRLIWQSISLSLKQDVNALLYLPRIQGQIVKALLYLPNIQGQTVNARAMTNQERQQLLNPPPAQHGRGGGRYRTSRNVRRREGGQRHRTSRNVRRREGGQRHRTIRNARRREGGQRHRTIRNARRREGGQRRRTTQKQKNNKK